MAKVVRSSPVACKHKQHSSYSGLSLVFDEELMCSITIFILLDFTMYTICRHVATRYISLYMTCTYVRSL